MVGSAGAWGGTGRSGLGGVWGLLAGRQGVLRYVKFMDCAGIKIIGRLPEKGGG